MRGAAAAAALLALALATAGCPKPPAAVMTSLEAPEALASFREAFNADAAHRRLLVLLSPT